MQLEGAEMSHEPMDANGSMRGNEEHSDRDSEALPSVSTLLCLGRVSSLHSLKSEANILTMLSYRAVRECTERAL